jgi:hypothetical protein
LVGLSRKKAKEIADFIILGKRPKSAKKKFTVKNKKKIIKNKKHGFKLHLFSRKHKKEKHAKKAKKQKANKFFLFGKKKKNEKEKKIGKKITAKKHEFHLFSIRKKHHKDKIKKNKKIKKKSMKLGFWHRRKKKEKKPVEKEKKPMPVEEPGQVFTTTGGRTRPIRTEIDDIYDFISKRKSVRIDVVAKHFKMEEKNVEKLAKILEENNLVMIDYPPFGKLMLEARQ